MGYQNFRRTRIDPLPVEYPGVHGMGEEEVEAALRVCRSKSLYRYYGIHLQQEVSAFEREFGNFLGIRHVVAVTSGTSALHTALSALRVGPGCEVIVPAFMWVSVIAAVVNAGAIPVLADIDETFCLDPADVRRKITPRTAGIIVAHMSGAPAAIEELVAVARDHNLFVVEDCAQCVGGSVNGKSVGTFGDIGIFSFQMNKNMSSGEGGAIVTNNELLYRKATAGQDIGFSRDQNGMPVADDIESLTWGRGCRLDELRAAILRVQLMKLPDTIDGMRRSKYRIRRFLESRPEVALRRIQDPAGDTGCALITTFTDAEMARNVNQNLRLLGICTASPDTSNVILADFGLHIYYNIPLLVRKIGTDHRGAPWTLSENQSSVYEYGKGACPRADDLFERSQLLTIPPCLTGADECQIIDAFEQVLDATLSPTPS